MTESPRSIKSNNSLQKYGNKSAFNSPGKLVDMNSPLFKTMEKKFIRNSIKNKVKQQGTYYKSKYASARSSRYGYYSVHS